MNVLRIWDYLVISVVLIISASIGIYFRMTGGKQKTTTEYLLGDRQMSSFLVAFSLMASFASAITLLGNSMEIYQYGTMFVTINVAYIISNPIIAYFILPVFHHLKTASVYEYLEMRFGYATRLCASLAFSIQMILYMGIVLFAPALALQAVTGLSQILSILLVGIICTFYSTLGGLKAVLITDIFQSLLMYIAVYSVIICAVIKANGVEAIWFSAVDGGRIEFDNFDLDPTTRHTWWSMLIGGSITYISIYGVNQSQVQRLLSVGNLRSSQAALWYSLPILMALSLSTCFAGLCIYYYYKTCDPLLQGRIKARDQLMPLFIVDTMSEIPAVSGLFISGIFAASLSTISSSICAMAAVTLEDYLKPLYSCVKKRPIDEKKTIWYTKLMALGYGIIFIALAYLAQSLGGVLQASLTIFGIVGGPLLGLFMLGMTLTSANQKGALSGLLVGLAISFWIGFGTPKPVPQQLPLSVEGCQTFSIYSANSSTWSSSNKHEEEQEQHFFYLYRLSYMWYSVIGFLVTYICGAILSCIYKKLNLDNNNIIFIDPNTRTTIKFELFIPPIANRLRKMQTASADVNEQIRSDPIR